MAGLVAGLDADDVVVAVAAAEGGVGVGLQAEDGMQTLLGMGVQQAEGVVAGVLDDDAAEAPVRLPYTSRHAGDARAPDRC